ncbi:MAG: 30S ribosomal protein S4 [Candidatus Micrarchaeota archaeon]|nr:MAG: 30S ribosomal protein S4 [Candidatus Micrarchaeota archaeon]
MGSPKRNKKTYITPRILWNRDRLAHDNSLVKEYGLKNMKELWIVQTEVSRIRAIARRLLAGDEISPGLRENLLKRLIRYGIVKEGVTVDSLLDINEKDILERRLQTIVYRKGLAKTIKQARQLIVHGFISVDGRKINKPSYLIEVNKENTIGYYKGISIDNQNKKDEQSSNNEADLNKADAVNA